MSSQFLLDYLNEDQVNVLENEKAGQLYAYRYSNTTVILGTRDASILGANAGIGSIAEGRYRCRAENFRNASDERELDIYVSGRKTCGGNNHIDDLAYFLN